MKRLTLDDDQARMLASWLRIAATQLDEQAAHLKSCGYSFAGPEQATRDQAERARTLAKRLAGD